MPFPSEAPRDTRGINKCPPEIIDCIVQQLPGSKYQWLADDNIWYYDQLRACSLVSRKWRHPSQRALHEAVTLTPEHAMSRLRVYIQGQEGLDSKDAWTARDISQYPRTLRFDWDFETSISDLIRMPEFVEFVRRSGTLITTLLISNTAFDSFRELVNLVALFPSLLDLQLEDCAWGVQTLEEAEGYRGIDTPFPPLLQTMSISCGGPIQEIDAEDADILDLLALSYWFATVPSSKSIYVDVRDLRFTDATFDATSVLLRNFGSQLARVKFLLDTEAPNLRGTCINLFNNTSLEELVLEPFVEGRVDKRFLFLTLLSINSPTFRHVHLGVNSSGEREQTPLEFMDLDGVVGLLSDQDRFPALDWVGVQITNAYTGQLPWSNTEGRDMWYVFHKKVKALRQRNIQVKAEYTNHFSPQLSRGYDSRDYILDGRC